MALANPAGVVRPVKDALSTTVVMLHAVQLGTSVRVLYVMVLAVDREQAEVLQAAKLIHGGALREVRVDRQ